MQAAQFLKYIQNPHQLTLGDVTALQGALHQYPYFQAAYTLIAKAIYNKDQTSLGHEVQTAAIYATDRAHLQALLEGEPPFITPAPEKKEAPEVAVIPVGEPKEAPPSSSEAYHFIDGYINHIRKKETREITKKKNQEQLYIIEAFIQKGKQFRANSSKEVMQEQFQVDLTQESTTFHDDLITESLAQVLFQQGKVQRAIEVYEKLGFKFPEKKTYFVSLAEELKTQT